MNSSELRQWLSKDPVIRGQFGNVCAADELPMHIRHRPRIYIVNTDKRHQPGKHWVVFYFPRRGPAEFFDSNGHKPSYYRKRFQRVLVKNERRYIYNSIPVQYEGTQTCGHYCLYYTLFRCRGESMTQIVHGMKYADVESFVNKVQ